MSSNTHVIRKEFNKLVRDRIPEIIAANGDIPHTRVMETEEYERALMEKISEEARELGLAGTRGEIIEEAADVFEVLEAMLKAYEISDEEVKAAKDSKRVKRGGFDGKIMLEYTEGK